MHDTEEERTLIRTTGKRQRKWIGHMLRGDSLHRTAIKGRDRNGQERRSGSSNASFRANSALQYSLLSSDGSEGSCSFLLAFRFVKFSSSSTDQRKNGGKE